MGIKHAREVLNMLHLKIIPDTNKGRLRLCPNTFQKQLMMNGGKIILDTEAYMKFVSKELSIIATEVRSVKRIRRGFQQVKSNEIDNNKSLSLENEKQASNENSIQKMDNNKTKKKKKSKKEKKSKKDPVKHIQSKKVGNETNVDSNARKSNEVSISSEDYVEVENSKKEKKKRKRNSDNIAKKLEPKFNSITEDDQLDENPKKKRKHEKKDNKKRNKKNK